MKRLLLSALLLTGHAMTRAGDWPQWRGPDGQGHAPGAGLPVKWSEQEGVAWRTELPGRGWSSPAVVDGRVWMTTAVETEASADEASRRLKTNTGDQPLTLLSKVELRALCVDAATGRLVHDVLVLTKRDPQWVHQLNSYASPSPVVADGRVFCQFGSLGTACVDAKTGKLLWTNEDAALQVMHENGPGSTPVVHDGRVIFHLDGSDRQFVAALDAATGKVAWTAPRSGKMHDNPQFRKSYGTPLVVTSGGRAQLISPASDWLYSYDPATGKELWKLPYGELGFSLTPRPLFRDGVVYFATGFGKSRLVAVRIDGPAPEVLWRFDKGAPTQPSPALVDGLLYFVNDGGVLTCVDAANGEEVYRERLGQPFSASPLVHDGRLYFPGREGTTFVIKAGRKFEKLAENKLSGRQFASFAADGDALLIRTDKALYRIPGGTARP